MIYSNQEALDKTEQRDFMLAIKALLQDQKDAKRDEHHDRTKETPREPSRHKVSDNTTRSPGSDADKSDPPATLGINLQNQAPPDPGASGLEPQQQNLEPPASIAAVQNPKSPVGTTNDRDNRYSLTDLDRERAQKRGVRPCYPSPELKIGIHLFLLKPVVDNYFDKVELTWSLQNTQIRESAIYRYMAQQGDETSVFNMLHTLHEYEKMVLDGVIFGIDMTTEGSVLSLKRTKTTICHRDITFTDVPGLQFVVRRERQYPDEFIVTSRAPRGVSNRERTRHGDVRRGGPGLMLDETSYREAPPSQSRQDDIAGRRRHLSVAIESVESDEDRYPSRRFREDASDSSSSEDQGYGDIEADQKPMPLPEQDEDVVIDDMLKKYTTLFD